MSIPFDDLASREVLVIPPNQTYFIKASNVQHDPRMTGTLSSGEMILKGGLVFTLIETYPATRAISWRLWNARSISMFRPFIETGEYRNRWIKVTRTGQGPSSDYVPILAPEGFAPSLEDLLPGPIKPKS